MHALEFSTKHENALRETTIDAQHPGSILHDFEVVCQFLGTEGVQAAGKYNLLPMDAISILDERLSRPLRLQLKRPQLRSHPYLHGLHLLLRATGLTRVDGVGDKARLRLDPVVLEQWNRLNQTEQFFTLLEATFLHANGTMIGERSRTFSSPLMDCMMEWQSLRAKGKRFDLRKPSYTRFMYGQNFLLALTDMLGLLQVDIPSKPVVPWCPQALNHTPFGDAFFTLMQQQDETCLYPPEEETLEFGAWQPILQPYFPEWRANLVLPKPELREGVFVFKVSLGKVWRRIAIPDCLTLEDLADAILDAVDFDADHLYEFTFRDQLGKMAHINHPELDEGPFADEFPIGELPLQPGQSMTYLFDFGESWEFDVKLEKIDPPKPRMRKPRVVAAQGKAPRQYPDAEW